MMHLNIPRKAVSKLALAILLTLVLFDLSSVRAACVPNWAGSNCLDQACPAIPTAQNNGDLQHANSLINFMMNFCGSNKNSTNCNDAYAICTNSDLCVQNTPWWPNPENNSYGAQLFCQWQW